MLNFFTGKKNKIFHMASMARSGETLMLKILATHPDIKVIHNLDKDDDKNSIKAFEYLKKYKSSSISAKNKVIKPFNISENQILLLKQGVWKHPAPFKGFILSRNPVSVYSSLKAYDRNHKDYDEQSNFWFENSNRLKRWLHDMEPDKLSLLNNKSPLEQFVYFYNIRMNDLINTGLPMVRYEDLVTKSKEVLSRVCFFLEVPMDETILDSHQSYEKGFIGHGQNDLSKPIDNSSLLKYKENVTEEEFNFIERHTVEVHEKYGYHLKSGEITWE